MAKKIFIFSPQNQTGKTIIANYLGCEISGKFLTAIIELNRYSGYSIYIQDKINEYEKSITNIYNNFDIEDNLIQSRHSKKLFFTSKNLIDELLDLHSINTQSFYKLDDYINNNFDYEIIDLPSNYIEKMLHDALDILRNEDIFIIVLDDNIQNLQILKHYDNYFYENELKISSNNIFYILNKNVIDNKEQISKIISSLKVFNTENELKELPYIKDLNLYINEGRIISNPSTKEEKLFINNLNDLALEITGNKPKKEKKKFFNFNTKSKKED